MVKLIRQGVYYSEGRIVKESQAFMTSDKKEKAVKNTAVYSVWAAHETARPDALIAEGETAKTLSEGERSALPLIVFGDPSDGALKRVAASRGGDFVPSTLAAPSEYLCECVAEPGALLLGSAACGALGALCMPAAGNFSAVLAGGACEISRPPVVALYLRGKPRKGVGPVDVALSILAVLQKSKFAAGKILEVFGAGVGNLSMDFRIGLDAMLPLTGCVCTLWTTDRKTEEYCAVHGRAARRAVAPAEPAYYEGGIVVDLSRVEPMIGFSEREIFTVREYAKRTEEEGIYAQAGVLSRETGSYETLAETADIVSGGAAIPFTVQASSLAVCCAVAAGGYFYDLTAAGVLYGLPVPVGGLVLWDAAAWREGGALMDARSIAATARLGGKISSALGQGGKRLKKYRFDGAAYRGVIRGNGE